MLLQVLVSAVYLAVASPAPSTSGGGGDPLSNIANLAPLLNVGFLGLIFVLLISKKFIVTKYYAEEGFAQRDAVIATQAREIEEWKVQVRDLQRVASDQLLPVVVESVAAQKEYTKVLNESLRDRRRRDRDDGT